MLELLQLNLLIKLFFSVLTLFYFVFVVVVYRQITLMTQVLDSKISPAVKLIALAQIFAVGALFFIGVLIA
ncbi:hypothetical protein HY310_02370 [Candidatus Microgenomates bacterium]|nr:hypothetical protein [Candidatus Microgenomates bacterium]